MADGAALVTVVIAAYNAEATIDATLASVRAQTHRNLEIIVVIDGATDDTETLVRRHARQDDRVTAIVTPNRGFCAARNTAVEAGRGDFIAPLDADDIWHPQKIEKQLAVFAAEGPELGMVYTLYRRIDQWDRVILDGAIACWSGHIFPALLFHNCVGTGSSMLIRTRAFEKAGGYSMDLNRLGCEDYLLQILISREWRVGVVPEFLTGYRFTPDSMSRNHVRMAEARLKMLDILSGSHVILSRDVMDLVACQFTAELAMAQLRAGDFAGAAAGFGRAARIDPWFTAAYSLRRLGDFAYKLLRKMSVKLPRRKPPKFQDMDPTARCGLAKEVSLSRTVRRLAGQTGSVVRM